MKRPNGFLAARARRGVALRREVGKNSANAASLTRTARVDPKVGSLAYVDVHEAAHGIHADADEPLLAREFRDVVVGRTWNDEIDRPSLAVIRGAPRFRSAV